MEEIKIDNKDRCHVTAEQLAEFNWIKLTNKQITHKRAWNEISDSVREIYIREAQEQLDFINKEKK